jgi:F0F1-type ATP synthase alpha subunit
LKKDHLFVEQVKFFLYQLVMASLVAFVDALGNPIDGKGEIKAEARRALELQAPSVASAPTC